MTFRALLLLSISILHFACAGAGSYTWASQLPPTAPGSELALRVGDRVQVVVYGQDAMSAEVEVRLGGDIVLPVTGRVQAKGYTVAQLTEVIRHRLQGILADPRVTVVIASRRPAGVSVVGEVTEPGRFEMRDGEGVLDAIARAQGLTPFANEDNIFVIRRDPNLLRVRFRYSDLRKANPASVGFLLKDGDVVVVE
jgi:polysaccharide export outer membrane protein